MKCCWIWPQIPGRRVPADLPDYIRQHDIVRAALRVAKEVDATDEEWKAFMEMLQNRQN